jgi:para-nitrobenzyl esterase
VDFAKHGRLPWPEFDRETRLVYRIEKGVAEPEEPMPAAPFLP